MSDFHSVFADVAKKDPIAFETLYRDTSPKLFALCLHILNYDNETAEEVLQEAYIKIWNKAERYNPKKGSPLAWMSTVARNQAFDRLRSYKYRPQLTQELAYESSEYASPDLGFVEKKSHAEQITFFKEQLEKLPEIQQQAITQSLIYGYTHDEISKELKVPLGTIKSWLRRNLPTIKVEMNEFRKVTH